MLTSVLIRAWFASAVMPGLVPGIHVFFVDGRVKPGHDDEGRRFSALRTGSNPA
jgi:hypothetical protein